MEKYDIRIKTKNVNINEYGLDRESALALVIAILDMNPDDSFITENLPGCIENFGFQSVSQDDCDIYIHSYKEK